MTDTFGDVFDFMFAMKQIVPNPEITPELLSLRAKLVREEYQEVMNEFKRMMHAVVEQPDLWDGFWPNVKMHLTKELCDLLYVTLGAFIAFDLPFDAAWRIVQESNMAKVGGLKDRDGKQLKPAGWEPPDAKLLELFKES
jgi:predicted HAD superfamily Cof-like phosphohydrolase